jgi:hypothetical protein
MKRLIGRSMAKNCTGLLVLSAILMGCAAQTVVSNSALSEVGAAVPAAPSPGYQLTPLEMKLDCPKLTGQMKVKIATMRGDQASGQTSLASRAMQSAVTPVFGGTKRGTDTGADSQRDRAKLDAFNKRLAEKNCKTLDIAAELRGDPPAAAPVKSGGKKAGER